MSTQELAPEQSEFNDPDALWERLRSLVPSEEEPRLAQAYRPARLAHEGLWRNMAEGAVRVPYIVHPLRVALIVAEEWQQSDVTTLATCLLHDVLEDVPWEERDAWERKLRDEVDDVVCDAVCSLSKPAAGPSEVKASRDARYFSELFRSPKWVRLVKCADRVDNLRDATAWGNLEFWTRYSSETIGWHLYLARETAPIAEVAIFKALVEGERRLKGCVPIWADGHMIDPVAAALVPEHIARLHGVIGLALQGRTLILGMRDPEDSRAAEYVRVILPHEEGKPYEVRPVPITPEALADALAAALYGQV